MRLNRLLRSQINVRNLIGQIYEEGPDYGFRNSPHAVTDKSKTVIVEYSSPNVCKPFHVGHLRSTILGHFIANLYEKLGWNVIRLNYLGDWGFQFGLLAVGFKRYGSEEALAENPLDHLFEIYVRINQDNKSERAKNEDNIFRAALEAFQKMENGDEEYLQIWKRFKDISVAEYAKMYQRLGVHFTENHFESTYAKPSLNIVKQLENEGKVETDDLGRKIMYRQSGTPGKTGEKYVVLQKSDGTTLYITRDIAALIDRYERFKFDKIHYVVEQGQYSHFLDIETIMHQIPGWEERLNENMHIDFGRIHGLSTRQGNVVFLSKLLDTAKERCKETLLKKSKQVEQLVFSRGNEVKCLFVDDTAFIAHIKATRIKEAEIDSVAEELGRSSIIVQDFHKNRSHNYSFNWNGMLYFKGDSGAFIQYCHSRLFSLENKALPIGDGGLDFQEEAIHSHNDAMKLIKSLSHFPHRIEQATAKLEPCVVVNLILDICHASNKAYRTCPVKQENQENGMAFLHMFKAARIVLANGMRLLGMKPLERM